MADNQSDRERIEPVRSQERAPEVRPEMTAQERATARRRKKARYIVVVIAIVVLLIIIAASRARGAVAGGAVASGAVAGGAVAGGAVAGGAVAGGAVAGGAVADGAVAGGAVAEGVSDSVGGVVATRPAAAAPSASTRPAAAGPSMVGPASYIDRATGGEAQGIVQVANLVYAGTKSSRCFSDHYLVRAEKDSAISTSRRFHAVKLGSGHLFDFPLVIMTGEGDFSLPESERENLRRYAVNGGVVVASAGCSSQEWDVAFRREMQVVFPGHPLAPISMAHPMFHMVYDIPVLQAKHGEPRPLEGISIGGRLAVIYSRDGLNDTAHAQGCCCCGGNELTNALEVNINILAYALMY